MISPLRTTTTAISRAARPARGGLAVRVLPVVLQSMQQVVAVPTRSPGQGPPRFPHCRFPLTRPATRGPCAFPASTRGRPPRQKEFSMTSQTASLPATDRGDFAATLVLRKATVDDAPGFARTIAAPEVFPQLLQMPYTNVDQYKARLAELAAPGKQDLLLVALSEGEIVGGGGLHPSAASMRRRHAMSLGIHVHPQWQGRGVGARLMAAICDYADNWLGLLRLELDVYTDNVRAQALYRRFGFADEGVHRAYAMRDGVYVDSLSMGRLNPAPLRGFPRE
jgi:L-phenylalanine/L-methionine N-acetyltransferase